MCLETLTVNDTTQLTPKLLVKNHEGISGSEQLTHLPHFKSAPEKKHITLSCGLTKFCYWQWIVLLGMVTVFLTLNSKLMLIWSKILAVIKSWWFYCSTTTLMSLPLSSYSFIFTQRFHACSARTLAAEKKNMQMKKGKKWVRESVYIYSLCWCCFCSVPIMCFIEMQALLERLFKMMLHNSFSL